MIARRSVLAAALSATAVQPAVAQTRARVVIIGGGFGGASAARMLKRVSPELSVTLVEPNQNYLACPFSNLVIASLRTLDQQRCGHDTLQREGVRLARDSAIAVDTDTRAVRLAGGTTLPYDRLILSPGIDLNWNALEGYGEAAAETMPHAWKAGDQTTLLQRQIEAMPDNGVVVMSVPAAPYRCPPGPYERASLIAHYLRTHKPRAKLVVLDAKAVFSKQALFQEAWATLYPDTLEWRGPDDGGRVLRVNAVARTVETEFETITADVFNVIPPQKAGAIAARAGVADATGWCPVDAATFQSRLAANVHVIGDATIAAPMPKSAFAANLHGKICALQIARALADEEPLTPVLANTCYSYVGPNSAISISGVYHTSGGAFAEVAGGVSALGASAEERAAEAAQAAAWFDRTTAEAFG
jgi:NADPH-dependent 2,4-dienoyl-CoA reductase/sulfur reductase-like enzyme